MANDDSAAAIEALPTDLKSHFETKSREEQLRLSRRPALLELYLRLLTFDWTKPEGFSENVNAAIALVARVTASGGPNDPSAEAAAEPWRWLIQLISQSSVMSAAKVARRWYRHLETHDRKRSVVSKHRGVAAYIAGSMELQRGNVSAARRWLHIAVIEDGRTGHRGVARMVLIESLGEHKQALDSLIALAHAEVASMGVYQAQAEYILTRWYLTQDLRRSDFSLDAEHELDGWLLRELIRALTAAHANATSQGSALEILAAYLLAHIVGCFPVRKSETPDFENDLVIRNLSRNVSPALDVLGRYFIVECKNRVGNTGSHEIAYFASRVRYGRATYGVLFAREGITGSGVTKKTRSKREPNQRIEDGRFMLHRAYHQDGTVIAVVTKADLERVANGEESILQLLLRKHDEVRFGSWSKSSKV